MAIMLKDLTARTPETRDFAALPELIHACSSAEREERGGELEGLSAQWSSADFDRARDAWVITTQKRQLVGFACLWHRDLSRLTTFLCVHPAFRQRGIGTLLLRMGEMRAREYLRRADAGQEVILQGMLNEANAGAQRLFEREGYKAGRPFVRLTFAQREERADFAEPGPAHLFTVDVGLESRQHPLEFALPVEQEVLYHMHFYRVYEKVLRLANSVTGAETASREPLALC